MAHYQFQGLWVDDERPMPEELIKQRWTRAPSFHEAVLKLELMNFKFLSLDHDLGSFYGNREMTGMDIVWWLIDRHHNGLYVPPYISVHSANPCGRENMISAINQHLDHHVVPPYNYHNN